MGCNASRSEAVDTTDVRLEEAATAPHEAGGAAVVTDDLLEYLVLALLRSDSECLVTHSSFIDEFLDLARPENGELAYHATNFTVACFFLMDAPVEDVRAMYDKHRQADSVSPLSKRPRQSISEFVQVESPSRRKSSTGAAWWPASRATGGSPRPSTGSCRAEGRGLEPRAAATCSDCLRDPPSVAKDECVFHFIVHDGGGQKESPDKPRHQVGD